MTIQVSLHKEPIIILFTIEDLIQFMGEMLNEGIWILPDDVRFLH